MKLQRYEPHIYRSLLEESRILFEASDTGEWVREDEALAEIARLRAAFEICHTYHMYPRHCASMVDHHYHELFPEAYNPHKKDPT